MKHKTKDWKCHDLDLIGLKNINGATVSAIYQPSNTLIEFCLNVFIEFNEFSEFLFHLGKTSVRGHGFRTCGNPEALTADTITHR